MKYIDLNLLTTLDALLTEQSVTAAAARLHLSTPAVSHALARIREVTGDPILARSGRRLSPTPRALEMREPVRALVEQARALLFGDGVVPLSDTRREFVVRAPDSLAIMHGAVLLAALRGAMPLASVRFVPESEGDALALRDGRIDLDIGPMRDRGPEIETQTLYSQHIVGAVRSGHPMLARRITLRGYLAQEHVAITQRNGLRELIDGLLAQDKLERRAVLTTPSAYGALMAASRSDLVATVPDRLARGVGPSLHLQVFKLPLAIEAEEVVLAWHPRLGADAPHKCLRASVLRVLSSAAGGR
jgi:DNA-binding transcriptional LysR family regulator